MTSRGTCPSIVAAGVPGKYDGVGASSFVDYLALMGDKADGVPGVPGIGTKRAAGLLRPAMLGLGALCVLGGSLPSLFVGCRVRVEAEASGAAALAQAVSAAGRPCFRRATLRYLPPTVYKLYTFWPGSERRARARRSPPVRPGTCA